MCVVEHICNRHERRFCFFRADLVPVYSFGENEVYKQVIFEEGSWWRFAQRKLQKLLGFAPCVFHGCGLFSSDSVGLVPYCKPITTVGEYLGISVAQVKQPLNPNVLPNPKS